jgi:hypothetical protein
MQVVQVGQFDDLTDPGYFAPGTIYEFSYDHDLQAAWCTSNPGFIDFVAASAADVVLRFSGGTIGNGTIKGNQTAINAPITLIFKNDLLIDDTGTWNVDKAYSDWFECYKNGYYIDPTTFNQTAHTYQYNGSTIASGTLCGATYDNDRHILQQLLNLSARHTIISEGIYMVDSAGGSGEDLSHQLTWYKKEGLILQIDGILKMIPNDISNYDILLIAESDNIKLCGTGKLVGDLPEHQGDDTPGSGDEGGMYLQVSSTSNFRLEGLTFEQGWGDGVYYSWRRYEGSDESPQSTHYWNEVKCLYNRRTGFGLEKGDYIYVTNSQFNYTGRYRGTDTYSGVDIEPFGTWDAPQRYSREIHFDKCVANQNAGSGFRFQRLLGGSIKSSEASFNDQNAVCLLNCNWGSKDKVWNDASDCSLFANRILIDGNTFINNPNTFLSQESTININYTYYTDGGVHPIKHNVNPDPDGDPDLVAFDLLQPTSAMIINNYVQNTDYVLVGGWKDTIVENNNIYNTGSFFYLTDYVSNLKVLNNYVLGINAPSSEEETSTNQITIFSIMSVANLYPETVNVLVKDNIFKYAGGIVIPGSNNDLSMPYPTVKGYLFRQGIDDLYGVKYINNHFDDQLWASEDSGTVPYLGNDGTMTEERIFTQEDMSVLNIKHFMPGDKILVNGQTGLVTVGGWFFGVGTTFDPYASYQTNQIVCSTDFHSMFIATNDGSPSGGSFPTSGVTTVGTLTLRHISSNTPVIEWHGVGVYNSNFPSTSILLPDYNAIGRRLIDVITGDMIKWDGSAWVAA